MNLIPKIIPAVLAISLLASTTAFAESPSPTTSVDFTVNAKPTISIVTSTDLVTLDLAPAANKDYDSASFTIHVGTNNPNGYHLFFNTEGDNSALVSDNGYSINALPDTNNNNGYNATNFPANTWGYNSNGDTWVYKTASANFFPLTTTATEIDGYNGPINDKSTTISLASKVDFESASGSYTKRLIISMLPTVIAYDLTYDANTTDTVANLPTLELQDQWDDNPQLTINTKFIPARDGYNFLGYTATNTATIPDYVYDAATGAFTPAALVPSTTSSTLYAVWDKAYIQDFTLPLCKLQASSDNFTVYDRRDNKDYTVRYINDQCWMTQNLRFNEKSITAAESNVTSDRLIAAYYSLGVGGISDEECDSTNGFSNACIQVSDSDTTGIWYNYYAATAGTISGYSNSDVTTQDICPRNWHLPTGTNKVLGSDLNKLIGNITGGWQDPTASLIAFNAVVGGRYNNGLIEDTDSGYWWSATASSDQSRYFLSYDGGNGQFSGALANIRYRGDFVRCVRSE